MIPNLNFSGRNSKFEKYPPLRFIRFAQICRTKVCFLKMAPPAVKKRKIEDGMRGKTERPKKVSKKQSNYHSSSEDSDAEDGAFKPVNLQDSDAEGSGDDDIHGQDVEDIESEDENEGVNADSSAGEDSEVSASGSESEESHSELDENNQIQKRKLPKRNDPTAFSTSMSKILSTKLPTSARSDPLLTRSKPTNQASTDIANERLERRARAKLRAEKKEELERGRIRDVLGTERGEAGETAEQEKRLRKIAQRGVVKLFNAVRTAQVRGEEKAREERRKRSTIGMDEREKSVNETTKQSFLDLINGKGGKTLNIEEA